ncbi:MMPL family transporter, partial [Streptomyces lushanensis]|uniref:MMPL family transporter n=1 Tax=Streptomyces lushanensis TaxID=1434255 RepID=UPI000AF1655A
DRAVEDADLNTYASELAALPGVLRVDAAPGTYVAGGAPTGPGNPALSRPNAHRIAVALDVASKSDAAQALVKEVRAVPAPAGANALVGGTDAELVDSKAAISGQVPLALGLVAVTTFVLLFLFTGSVVQPVRALVLNVISLGATLGAMTWIYQDGNLASLLGVTPQPMDASMTVLMFVIAFGLSMDYEVFVTSRIKELHDLGEDNETAVTHGLGHTGGIVTAAACLLAVSFFAFGTAQLSFMQMFGLGSGLAILIDAVAVRGVLVPAAMRLLGRSAWYAPGFLRRFHARYGLSESGPGPVPAAGPVREKEYATN